MKKKILWTSIIINICFVVLLILISYKYREDLYQNYIIKKHSSEIVMFGDSQTAGGKWNFILDRNPVLRMGWGGFSSDQLAGLIPRCIEFKPKFVFILCGGNDIGGKCFSIDNTIKNFKFMADTLKSNNIKPVFQKLLYQHNSPKFNAIIDSINICLSAYCLKENIDLIDIGTNMYDSTGLKGNLTVDNVHLNKNGYKIWSDVINAFLKDK